MSLKRGRLSVGGGLDPRRWALDAHGPDLATQPWSIALANHDMWDVSFVSEMYSHYCTMAVGDGCRSVLRLCRANWRRLDSWHAESLDAAALACLWRAA